MFVDFTYKKVTKRKHLNLVKTKDFIVKMLGLKTCKDLQKPFFLKGKGFLITLNTYIVKT